MKKGSRLHASQIGEKYNRLTVVGDSFHRPETKRPEQWHVRCLCECGEETVVEERRLQTGKTKSCRCIGRESARKRMHIARKVANDAIRTHGDSTSRLYGLWCQMRARCNLSTNQNYSRYGAKGIKVCSEWDDDYSVFRNWAHSNGYIEGLTIDRIDPDKGYEPSNCRWLSRSENSRYATTYRVAQVEKLKVRVQELEAILERSDVIEASQEDR